MPQISNSEDAFIHLVEDSPDHWLCGCVAFARFEERRIEWLGQFRVLNEREPSDDEVTRWYRQQPDDLFLKVRHEAELALKRVGAAVDGGFVRE